MKLVVGLGNPGPAYRGTRHNVGFLVADRFAQIHHMDLTRTRFRALVGDGVVWDEKVVVAKPQTYMN
ncbi:MAG: aminoacyl-tRNA hydrolase, partial [Planctomycetes bacterium]|nr:aminoacyl-tRNA hydrolase [Planctomycetota bacterium]